MLKNILIVIIVGFLGFAVYAYVQSLTSVSDEDMVQVEEETESSDEEEVEIENESEADVEIERSEDEGLEVGYELEGQVVVGPTCPVEREGEECEEEGLQTTVAVLGEDGTLIQELSTTGSGEFYTILPSGKYRLEAAQDTQLPSCTPLLITIPSPSSERTIISCDSGIR